MLIPREAELATLSGALAAAAASGGRVVLVRGEAGIGKTTLISQFAGEVDEGVRSFVGYCDNVRTPQPFGPFWDIGKQDEPLRSALKQSDHTAVVDALLSLMSAATGNSSAVIVEDTQWADEATLDLLAVVGRRIAQTNSLLVLTYRDAEVDYDHPVRSVIAAVPPDRTDRITLGPMSMSDLEQIARGRVKDLNRLMELTAGNPLLIEEIAVSGLDSVPPSIEDLVAARIGTVSEPARRLLDTLSVAPGGLESVLLSKLSLDDDQALAEAGTTGWLNTDDSRVVFRHDVIRRAVETMLSDTSRRRINHRVAEVLIESHSAPAHVVHHAEEAGDVDALIEFAPTAARIAMEGSSHREALAHYRSLGPYLEDLDTTTRVDILADWAACAFHNGDHAAVELQEKLTAILREQNDIPALVVALAGSIRMYQTVGRQADAQLAAEESLTLGTIESAGRERAHALSQSAWLSLMHGDPSTALRHSEEAIDLAEAFGDTQVLVHALDTKGSAHPNDAEGATLLERASQLARANGLWFEYGRALLNRAQIYLTDMTDLDDAESLARRAVDTGSQHELETLRTFATSQLATILFYKGEWDAASELAYGVLGTNRQTDATALTRLGVIQARRGNSQAEPTLQRAWEASKELGELQHIAAASAAWAEFCWISGRETDPTLTECFVAMNSAAKIGLEPAAVRIAAWLFQMQPSTRMSESEAADIESWAARSFDLWMRGTAPYDSAIAQLIVGSGRELDSLETLETLGATPVAAKHRQRLRAAGISVPRGRSRQTRAHPAGLTAREAEILELVSHDMTNAQIADELFLSLRTVEKHVSAVLGKLNAGSRTEVAAIASQMGLLSPIALP